MKTLLFLLLPAAACAAELPLACTLSSRPSDAALEVDGIPAGSTPASLSLAPGRHVARIAAPGAPATFAEFDVSAGRSAVRFDLPAPTAPVLVDSDPRGASVSLDGFEAGATPLLLPEVPAGRHVFAFSLAGFGNRVEEIDLVPPSPVRLAPALAPLGAALSVESSPAGALAIVGGMPRGATPLVVDGLPAGPVEVRLELAGHRPFVVRADAAAGATSAVSAVLEPRPGSIRVITEPAGAAVWVDDRRIGVSPVTAGGLAAGDRRLRILHDGLAPVSRTVALAPGEARDETFALVPDVGSIRVATTPPGVEVRVDGELLGTTARPPAADKGGEPAPDRPSASAPLLLSGVPTGPHRVVFSRSGYAAAGLDVRVEFGKTAELPVVVLEKIFRPDFLVETSLRVYKGVFVEKTDKVYRLELEPGVFREFPFEDVQRAAVLDDEALVPSAAAPGK